uniref:Uncharacterized protein n=1 Tax=Strigamia maritima TaxID=126957 RepID=T1J0P3_STRMM
MADVNDTDVTVASAKIANAILANVANVAKLVLGIEKSKTLHEANADVASAKIANAILASVANVANTALAIEKSKMFREASANVANAMIAPVILADAANAAKLVLVTEPSPAAHARTANALKPKETATVANAAKSAVAPRKVAVAKNELVVATIIPLICRG